MKNLVTSGKADFLQNDDEFSKNIKISSYIAECKYDDAIALIDTLTKLEIESSLKRCKELCKRTKRLSSNQLFVLTVKTNLLLNKLQTLQHHESIN